MEHIAVIDCRHSAGQEEIISAADTRRNFITVFHQPEEVRKVCAILKCSGKPPERLTRWGINALLDVLAEEDVPKLLSLSEEYPVHLFEQLFLDWSKPPKTAPFIVYCELRGIISDHHDPASAMRSLLDYLSRFDRGRLLPLAGIYKFEDGRWVQHRASSTT